MAKRQVLSVSALNRQIRAAIDRDVGTVWIEGEISSLTQAQSGHVYLTLKDENSQVRCIIWRSTLERLRYEPTSGQKILCRGKIDVYLPRGDYQLTIDRIELQGVGRLEMAFRQLHAKLESEGLFAIEAKKEVPPIPQHIALITSPAGAAIADFLKILLRRWPTIRVTLIPVPVQGTHASTEIALAVRRANRMNDRADVIVLTRGGGSLEDLWAFNEEPLIREVFQSEIPVVSAVGHEVDITLCDLVADARAATPSEAAETMVPDRSSVLNRIHELRVRLQSGLRRYASEGRQQLKLLAESTVFSDPFHVIRIGEQSVDLLAERLERVVGDTISKSRQKLENGARQLEAISPLAVLARGYSVTQDSAGRVIRNAESLEKGDKLITRFNVGLVESQVTETPDSGA